MRPTSPDRGAAVTVDGVLSGPPVTWVMTGDSITQGSRHTYGWRCYPELVAERVRWELARRSDVVVNTGAYGATIDEALADLDWRVTRFAPDVVTVMYGTNDSVAGGRGPGGFASDLERFVDRVGAGGALVVLQTPPPLRWGEEIDWAPVDRYAERIRALATERSLPLVDHYARWLAAGTGRTPPQSWFDDDAHPGAAGQLELARAVLAAFGDRVADSDVLAQRPSPPG